ncbi:type VI secretion system baseplate subunit TssK [Pseudomonas syringae]|uniref:Type VI secretion system baseplate subunit TssK n=5 Tax=Pseudomonas syringae TaxID=317 RepID=A0A9Q4FF17_PSESX|nr:type VI secretion system baseplate subunit TssK [Pseudomonas syringae]MCF5466574.1 type VI secretion system baseplate subunit TssK [Pseudomonas syringae]MCF5471166.1 type VI secretion system baseplate subunit TssK [Pseudomonas syringae]MCF5482539.1 type VI secretion system baseplate subunit TssK [Pseudomonas syringae]MCF5486421.1 type VI secretion system baseplate subunit TssK [Pseudomonas syringae]MCF5491070.1 type VI secretion system baseplate subunit TssK [Pseudomonas syringae]
MNSHKVIWQEGMLLRPQHFQHNDRYYDHQLRVRTQLAGAYNWGFTTLEIDPQFLGSGQIVLAQASGILPDGSVFDIRDRDMPLALDIPANTSGISVYIALPIVAGNCIEARSHEQSDVVARFTAYAASISDSNAGEHGSTSVFCARPEFRLLLDEPRGEHAYAMLKLCHVQMCSPDKAITLDANFSPTFINAGGARYLMSCLKEVVSLLGHRGEVIAERIGSHGQASGAQVGDFMMLQLVNRNALVLQHYLHTGHVHPEELYRVLLGLLGELSTFADDSRRPQLEGEYQHSDQGATFQRVMLALRQMLSMVLEQHAQELELQPRQYGVLVSPRVDRELLGAASFVLAARAHCDAEELRLRLPSHLKVGSVESIRELVGLHLPGIRLRPLPVAPRQIPFHAARTYFILDIDDHEQAEIDQSGGFAFHVSGEFSGLELQFWAIRN